MLYSKQRKFSTDLLKKEFEREYNLIDHVLKDYPFIRVDQESNNNEEILTVTNFSLLYAETQKVATIIQNDNHQSTDTMLKTYSVVITVIVFMLTVMQWTVNVNLDKRSITLQENVAQLQELSTKSSLILPERSFVFAKNEENEPFYNIKFCVRNKGGIDTGWIWYEIKADGFSGKAEKINEIKAMSYDCIETNITKKENITSTNINVLVHCLNCEEDINETFEWKVY